MGRLAAFDNARAMLRIENVFPIERCFINPLEPVKLKTVFLLKRNYTEAVVVESLDVAQFITRLMIGLTPDGKRETAYNAYRAVDDNEERSFIDDVENAVVVQGDAQVLVLHLPHRQRYLSPK